MSNFNHYSMLNRCYDFMVQVRKSSLNYMQVEDDTKELSEKE